MTKIITFQTNYNNKMGCECFTHIDVAPASRIPESRLEDTTIEIRTADQSHPPVKAKLIDLIRIPLGGITDYLTYPSHGVDSRSFQDKMVTENQFTREKQMAVYFYKRII
jgi:hypothetical protein